MKDRWTLFTLFLLSLFFLSPTPSGPDYTSTADGSWSSSRTWTERGTPDCSTNKEIVIDGDSVNCACDPMEIKGNGSITIKNGGTLVVSSDAGIAGDGDLTVEEECSLEVQGDMDLSGSSNFTLNGSATVEGDLTASGSATASGSGNLNLEGGGCSNFSGDSCTQSSPLPIELKSFEINQTDNNTVQITWATASETNNDYFTLERSKNGLSFQTIKEVEGAGNSNTTLAYKVIDENPVKGTAYYRLKQTDFNGDYEIFNMVAVEYETEEDGTCTLMVYPNPCPGSCNIKLSDCPEDQQGEMKVDIYDITGNHVTTKMNGGFSSGNNSSLHLNKGNNLTPGVYIIRASKGEKQYQEKVKVE